MSFKKLIDKQIVGSPWVYDATKKEYSLTIDAVVVAIIDSHGNLKIKGRILKIW